MMPRLTLCFLLFFSLLQANSTKTLYEKCANCHGNRGEEKAFGKSYIIASLSKEEIIQALKEYQAGTRDRVGMGSIMEGQVYKLSLEEIIQLATYIKTLK